MKKIFCALLAVVMLLSVASCGEKEPTETSGTAETSATEVSGAPDEAYVANYPDGFDYRNAKLDDYITLGKYKGLTVTLTTSSEITDADLQAYISDVISQHITTAAITDRACQIGDDIVIDYAGSVDGVAFAGGTASDQAITLGNGGFIEGFEDGIVGMMPGETKTVKATFPDTYTTNPDLAGKTADFEITLDSINQTIIPEYNDQFVRDNFDYDTMAEYEAYAKGVLKENRESEILAEKNSSVLQSAVDNATVTKYPEGLVEDYVQQQLDYVKYYATMYSMEYSAFVEQALKTTVDEYEATVKAEAEQSVKQELVVHAIAKAEGISISDEDHATELASFLEYYSYDDAANMCTDYGITEKYLNNTVDFSILYAAVLDILLNNATFTGAN